MAELFKSQIRFYGKHGQYLEALSPLAEKAKDLSLPEIERNKYLFASVVEIYELAPLIGYLYQRKAPRDGGDSNKNIFEGALATHHDKLVFSYQLLMILDKGSEPDLNERIRRAFSADDALIQSGMELFNDYARGGIEVLYENLVESAATPEDFARNLVDFIDDYNEKFLEAVTDLDVEKLLK